MEQNQWRTQKIFVGGVLFSGICVVSFVFGVRCFYDVIFMFSKPTFWRSLRWSAIADKIKTTA